MSQTSRLTNRHIAWVLLASVPILAFLVLNANSDIDPQTIAPEQHFYIVSISSLVCFALAGTGVAAAIRTRDPRISLISAGFLAMAGVFAIHGLSTPGYLVDGRYFAVTGFSARTAVWLGALFLFLSALPMPRLAGQAIVRARIPAFGVTAALVVGWAIAALGFPERMPPRVISAEWFIDGTLVTVLLFGAVSIVAYLRLYRQTGLAAYGAIAVGSALIVETQISMHYGQLWNWSWWLYHLQLLGAFVTMLWFPFALRRSEAVDGSAAFEVDVTAELQRDAA